MASGQFQMSLPSINEMFPEHMMQNWYDASKDASRNNITSNDPSFSNQSHNKSAVSRTDFPVNNARQAANTDYHRAHPAQGTAQSSQAHRHPRLEGAHDPEPYGPRRSQPASSYPPTNGAPPPTSSMYSFDLLRSHHLTSSLDTVATSTNAALQPRVVYVGFQAPEDRSPEMDVATLQRLRPSFHAQTSPQASRDNALLPPIHVPVERPVDYTRAYSDPIGYPENPYLACPVSSSNPQSLYRMGQAQAPPSPILDDKKHCCPHCDKRFNRPSSLNIHVNTHTGAKPFRCPYPDCQRRFNVNSNMRRHWRNHLTNTRRRDAVARLVEPTAPTMPPTPPLSTSPTDTPVSQFSGALPSSASSESSTPLPSRSPSPVHPYQSASDDEDEMHADSRASYDNHSEHFGSSSLRGGAFASDRNTSVSGLSHDRRRLRSRSSPVPRFHDESGSASAYAHGHHLGPGPLRARSSSCTVPGCGCQPVSTTLRPAFPASSIRSSKSFGNP